MAAKKRDFQSLSNYDVIRTTQVSLNFDIDFEKKRLSGSVVLKMKVIADECTNIILDTKHLEIKKVSINSKEIDLYVLGPEQKPYGMPLKIPTFLPEPFKKDDEVKVEIQVNTTDECLALQWLEPEQTSTKKAPYMFTQCQAIHCRTLFPCQDTPDVKAPVYYCLRSPYPIIASGHFSGDTVLHGGPWNSVGHFPGSKFEQRIPIPSYLIAIASGDITSQPIGPRSVVVTSPDEIAKCKWELENDMEKFLEAAESIVFKYQWGTYNVLVLPPSFPYGGMENPVYTFATPTIISGDRQNIDVIAHELAHSWSGNLVSNASWEHFWLNEGWTTYLERRIQAKIHGEPHRDFSAIIGWKALQDSVDGYGADHEFTKLVINLENQDPDDAFSTVPYDKGYTFLDYLERLLGREQWDLFIPHYFRTWMLKSLDSFEFKKTLEDFFKDKKEQSDLLGQVDWQSWFYKPGMPPKPPFDDSMARVCTDLAKKWHSRQENSNAFAPAPSDVKNWVGNQCVVFLEAMQLEPEKISLEDSRLLNKTYGFQSSQNVEILARTLQLSLMKKDEQVFDATADLLSKVGRMKFVRPLYRQLKACSLGYAINVFERNKNFYHPICRSMVEKDLYGKEAKA